MNQSRRQVMQLGVGATALGLTAGMLPNVAVAADAPGWNEQLFGAKSIDDVAKILGATLTASSDVSISGPDIAENGAVVPVSVKSTAAGVTAVGIAVLNNPTVLSALFNLKGADADIGMRVKMAKTSDVYAIALANGKLLFAKKQIKVTLGGCGG